jgi:hypothetical protein
MTYRYIHRDNVPAYEKRGWINADRFEKTRNQYFVLMILDKAHGN